MFKLSTAARRQKSNDVASIVQCMDSMTTALGYLSKPSIKRLVVLVLKEFDVHPVAALTA